MFQRYENDYSDLHFYNFCVDQNIKYLKLIFYTFVKYNINYIRIYFQNFLKLKIWFFFLKKKKQVPMCTKSLSGMEGVYLVQFGDAELLSFALQL
jgi:hypothetical protein